MQIFGGGKLITRDKLVAGNWVYSVDYDNLFCFSKVIKDDEGDLLFLNFIESGKEPVTIRHVANSFRNFIKLDVEPTLTLYPKSITVGSNEAKTGYVTADLEGNLSVVMVSSHHFKNQIQKVRLDSHEVNLQTHTKASDIFYTKWELYIPSGIPSEKLASFKYGFND